MRKKVKINNELYCELGQIKQFSDSYGSDVLMKLMEDIFGGWDMYKRQWKISNADYPTIGIIVTYGKGKIISVAKEIKEKIPEKESTVKPSKTKKIGW